MRRRPPARACRSPISEKCGLCSKHTFDSEPAHSLTIPMRFYDGIWLSCALHGYGLQPYGLHMSEVQRKTVRNGQNNGGTATWRSRQGIYSDAGALSSPCDVQRLRWAMGRENLLFLRLSDFGRSPRCEAPKKQSWSCGNPRAGLGGRTKSARMSGSVVDLSTKQSIDPSGGPMLLEQCPIWELDRANCKL